MKLILIPILWIFNLIFGFGLITFSLFYTNWPSNLVNGSRIENLFSILFFLIFLIVPLNHLVFGYKLAERGHRKSEFTWNLLLFSNTISLLLSGLTVYFVRNSVNVFGFLLLPALILINIYLLLYELPQKKTHDEQINASEKG